MTTKFYKILCFGFISFVFWNCQSDQNVTVSLSDSEVRQNEVFHEVSKHWQFTSKELTTEAQNYLNNWEEWRAFHEEAKTKPLATLSAFKQKSQLLTERVAALESSIPEFYQNPQIKTRLKVLLTNFQSLDMYLHLDDVPLKKVKYYLAEINKNWQQLIEKMNELQYKSVIPKEEGEINAIIMKDTLSKKNLDEK